MSVYSIKSFLVAPLKGKSGDPPSGVELPLSGKMFDHLSDIYESSEKECKIGIVFQADTSSQYNPARELLATYAGETNADKSMIIGAALAHWLQLVTSTRSGVGLFFIMLGKTTGGTTKIILCRFPTERAIKAETDSSGKLSVEFVEQVFLKSLSSYKAVAYADLTLNSTTWAGKAVDRQITDLMLPTSKYWIYEFLRSEFAITSKLGSERVAIAFQKVANGDCSQAIKQEVTTAAALLARYDKKAITPKNLFSKLPLSGEAEEALLSALPNVACHDETFEFSNDCFSNLFKYRTKLLDNGVLISAPVEKFDDLVKGTQQGPETKFEVSGKVVDDRIEKVRKSNKIR